MEDQQSINFERIATAIDFISNNYKSQPQLDEVAEHVHLSPHHFQRLFTDWAGVSPKKFLQYITVSRAKQILGDKQPSLFDVAHETGLSGTGRLHDLFISIEGMTPGEYKNGGGELNINYSLNESPFGKMFVASTDKGVCKMAFTDHLDLELSNLKSDFPNARYINSTDELQMKALTGIQHSDDLTQIKLHLKGTDFQLKVWEALLKIPHGSLTTYGRLANEIGNPKASRAVGSAVGDNPVAFLIPCHRVIQSTGQFGQYHWGSGRKTAIIGWEAAKLAS